MVFRFENSELLWLIILALGMGGFLWKRAAPRKVGLLTAGLCLCIIGLSRPQLGRYTAAQSAKRGNLFLAIDISKSMLAEDITPSRLAFAVAFCRKLLPTLKGIRVAMFPFAKNGYLQMPLSTDLEAAGDLLSTLGPSMTTSQGTDLGESLSTLLDIIIRLEAAALEKNNDWAPTQVLIFSDGESHRKVSDSIAGKFREHKIPIFSVGVGTVSGATIPTEARFGSRPEPLVDQSGQTVRSSLESETLKRISQKSGGDYFPGTLEKLSAVSKRLTQSLELRRIQAAFEAKGEYYPLCFALALLVFAIEFGLGRWQYLIKASLVLVLIGTGGTSKETLAISSDTEEKLAPSGEQRAVDAFAEAEKLSQEKKYQEASELFQESSSLTKDNSLKKKSLYNLGNTLLKMEDPAQALHAYQQARDVKASSRRLETQANQLISDNMVIATKKQKQQQQQSGSGKETPQPQTPDQKGQQNYRPELFNEEQKRHLFDEISREEQQILQRQADKRKSNNPQEEGGKTW